MFRCEDNTLFYYCKVKVAKVSHFILFNLIGTHVRSRSYATLGRRASANGAMQTIRQGIHDKRCTKCEVSHGSKSSETSTNKGDKPTLRMPENPPSTPKESQGTQKRKDFLPQKNGLLTAKEWASYRKRLTLSSSRWPFFRNFALTN